MGNETSRPPSAASDTPRIIIAPAADKEFWKKKPVEPLQSTNNVGAVANRPDPFEILRSGHKSDPTASLLSFNKPTTLECLETASALGHALVPESYNSDAVVESICTSPSRINVEGLGICAPTPIGVLSSHMTESNYALNDVEGLKGKTTPAPRDAPSSQTTECNEDTNDRETSISTASELLLLPDLEYAAEDDCAVPINTSLSSIDIPETFDMPSVDLANENLSNYAALAPSNADDGNHKIVVDQEGGAIDKIEHVAYDNCNESSQKSPLFSPKETDSPTIAIPSNITDTEYIKSNASQHVTTHQDVSQTPEVDASFHSAMFTSAVHRQPPLSNISVSTITAIEHCPLNNTSYLPETETFDQPLPVPTSEVVRDNEEKKFHDNPPRKSSSNTNEAKSPSSTNINIPTANTYAEATNLAARFPELAAEILLLPLRPATDSQVQQDRLTEIKAPRSPSKDNISRNPSRGERTRFKDKRQRGQHKRSEEPIGKETHPLIAKFPVETTAVLPELAGNTDIPGLAHTDERPNWAAAPLPPDLARAPSMQTNYHITTAGTLSTNDHMHQRYGQRNQHTKNAEETNGADVKSGAALCRLPKHSLAAHNEEPPQSEICVDRTLLQSVHPSRPIGAIEPGIHLECRPITACPCADGAALGPADQKPIVPSESFFLSELFAKAMNMKADEPGLDTDKSFILGERMRASVTPGTSRPRAADDGTGASKGYNMDPSIYPFSTSTLSTGTSTSQANLDPRGGIEDSRPMIPLRRHPRESHNSVPEWRTKDNEGSILRFRNPRESVYSWAGQPLYDEITEQALREVDILALENDRRRMQLRRSWTPSFDTTERTTSSFNGLMEAGAPMRSVSNPGFSPRAINADVASSFSPAASLENYYGRIASDTVQDATREGLMPRTSRGNLGLDRLTEHRRLADFDPRDGGLRSGRREIEMMNRRH